MKGTLSLACNAAKAFRVSSGTTCIPPSPSMGSMMKAMTRVTRSERRTTRP